MNELIKRVLCMCLIVGMFLQANSITAYASTSLTQADAIQATIIDCEGVPEHEYKSIFLQATDADMHDLEQMVYWESVRAGAPFETSLAAIETTLNRCLDGEFPNTISKVIRQKGQYATVRKFNTHTLNETESEEVCDAIAEIVDGGRTILPSTDYVYFDNIKHSYGKDWIWIGATNNGIPVKGKGMWYGRKK